MSQQVLNEQNTKIRQMRLEIDVLQRKINHLEYQIIQDQAVFNVCDYVTDQHGTAYMVSDRIARRSTIRSKNYRTSVVYVCVPANPDGTVGTLKKILSAKQITLTEKIRLPEF